jgi:hypothetical protein
MSSTGQPGILSRPRLDGRRLLFEVAQGGGSVTCAISLGALQDLGGRRHFRPADLLRCFEEARGRIAAVALRKLRARPEGASGLVNIWADDVEDEAEAAV